jgi:putative ABC transport system permease protein
VIGAVVRSGLRLTAAGIALGLAGSVILSRSLSGFLFGVSPNDPAVFLSAAAVLVAAALVASLVPATRAVQADPLTILREE